MSINIKKEIEELKNIEELKDVKPYDMVQLALEIKKVKKDRYKGWVTLISILIPLIIAAITIIKAVWLQNERAKIDFTIKITEFIMHAPSMEIAREKAIILYTLFPDYLPRNFDSKMTDLYQQHKEYKK
jgi:hypothetical protein